VEHIPRSVEEGAERVFEWGDSEGLVVDVGTECVCNLVSLLLGQIVVDVEEDVPSALGVGSDAGDKGYPIGVERDDTLDSLVPTPQGLLRTFRGGEGSTSEDVVIKIVFADLVHI
jgi:hypothetical protein